MTASALRELFVTLLVGVVGGDPAEWRRAIGRVRVHPLTTHPASNWSISPGGSAEQRDAVRKAATVIRAEHPYVDRD